MAIRGLSSARSIQEGSASLSAPQLRPCVWPSAECPGNGLTDQDKEVAMGKLSRFGRSFVSLRRGEVSPICFLLCTFVFAGCVAPGDVTGQSVQAVRSRDGGVCASDARGGDEDNEDDENDIDGEAHRLNVDCGEVRNEIRRRQTGEQHREIQQALNRYRRGVRHRHVPLANLIAFERPAVGMGRPNIASDDETEDRIIAMVLCDDMTREIVLRRYMGFPPSF